MNDLKGLIVSVEEGASGDVEMSIEDSGDHSADVRESQDFFFYKPDHCNIFLWGF